MNHLVTVSQMTRTQNGANVEVTATGNNFGDIQQFGVCVSDLFDFVASMNVSDSFVLLQVNIVTMKNLRRRQILWATAFHNVHHINNINVQGAFVIRFQRNNGLRDFEVYCIGDNFRKFFSTTAFNNHYNPAPVAAPMLPPAAAGIPAAVMPVVAGPVAVPAAAILPPVAGPVGGPIAPIVPAAGGIGPMPPAGGVGPVLAAGAAAAMPGGDGNEDVTMEDASSAGEGPRAISPSGSGSD